jgi:hypothetical protein
MILAVIILTPLPASAAQMILTGNLLVPNLERNVLQEVTPAGGFVQEIPLPAPYSFTDVGKSVLVRNDHKIIVTAFNTQALKFAILVLSNDGQLLTAQESGVTPTTQIIFDPLDPTQSTVLAPELNVNLINAYNPFANTVTIRANSNQASGLAIYGGSFYLSESSQIIRHDFNGVSQGTFATLVGSHPSTSLAFDANGNLYAAQFGSGVGKYDASGSFVQFFADTSEVIGIYYNPVNGLLYAGNSAGQLIILNTQGVVQAVNGLGGSWIGVAGVVPEFAHSLTDVIITGPASGAVFPVNTPISFTSTFTGGCGTSSGVWSFDAMTQAATIVEPSGATPGSANTTFSFGTPGIYTASLTVDNSCGVDTASTVGGLPAYVVVYDPSEGFVTGGGWFNSPEGAYAQNPALTGKASFGFVAKYLKGANVPSGETKFKFQLAGHDFESVSLDWLVVGSHAQYKGRGTINGAGNYGFMVTAVPGNAGVGKFRIKIVDLNNNGILVYDNKAGSPADSADATIIGGGSIVIHKK